MNKTYKKIKDFKFYTSATIIKSIFFTFIEIHIINVTVNYFIYNTFDIFNIKTIIPSLFYGIIFGIVNYYVVRRIYSKNKSTNNIEVS